MKKKPNPRDVLAALLDAEIAQEITQAEFQDYGLMPETGMIGCKTVHPASRRKIGGFAD